MKEKEAPKKIYLSAIDLEEVGHFLTESNDRYDVEYIRADIFIKNVCEFFGEHFCEYIDFKNTNYNAVIKVDCDKLKEDFKNYIKGE